MPPAPPGLASALQDRYRIERELGQGGMATVYLAEDLKHHRKVAVKVLRPELAATLGPERFAREIAVAARLQHPHILGLLDSGQSDGFFYYVMPFVEGETLRERLTRAGELPVPEAVRLLSEIAEALAVAHRTGVVHRDIKPENVLLSGRHALVMDFGVAKAVTEASGRQQLTTAGVALGTPAYMAPEQASADPQMDGRVDIYAIGVLAYEMLTGHTPFPGLNPQQTLAAHVTQTPAPVGQQRSGLSPALEAVVMRCLAKRPADRFQTADELALQLEPLATPSGGMTPTHTQPVQATMGMALPRRRLVFAAGAATVVALIAIVAFAASRGRARGPAAVVEQRQLTFTGDAYNAAISPDGKWLAYVSRDTALLVQEVAGGRAVPVLRGRSFRQPVWSPDGGSLLIGTTVEGDLARDAVWEIPRLGGEPKRVGSNGFSYDYSPDGRSIAWVVFDTLGITDRKTGSELRRLAVPGATALLEVRWSPDGRWLALGGYTAKSGAGSFLMDSAGPAMHPISRELGQMVWNEDGTALYILSNSRIVRQQIDRRSGTPRDSGETVLSGLSGAGSFSLSRDGHTLAVNRGPSSSRNLAVSVPPSGNLAGVEALPLSSGTGAVGSPAVSPDGRWVAWTDRTGPSRSVCAAGALHRGHAPVIARYEGPRVSALRWSPDSRRFGYFVGDSSPFILYTATTDGVAPVRVASLPAGLVSTGGVTLTWAAQGLVVPDSGLRGYQLIDPSSGSVSALAPFDSLTGLYSSVISPDGKTLIAARWRPYGFANDLWQLQLGSGTWTPVPYTVPGDPTPLRWDKSGIYVAISFFNRPLAPYEIWRTSSPGEPFVPVLTGLKWCTSDAYLSLSDDGRRLACRETTTMSDVWLATGFDGGGQ